MIFNELTTTTQAMQTLQKRKALKENKDKQENTDIKYRLLLTRTNSFVDVIDYLYSTVGLSRNDEILTSLTELIDELEQIIQEGLATSEGVSGAEKSFNMLQSSMKLNCNNKLNIDN